MLGRLYHLHEQTDRIRVLGEARRVVRPNGLVAVAAISRFASLFDGLVREYRFDPSSVTSSDATWPTAGT